MHLRTPARALAASLHIELKSVKNQVKHKQSSLTRELRMPFKKKEFTCECDKSQYRISLLCPFYALIYGQNAYCLNIAPIRGGLRTDY